MSLSSTTSSKEPKEVMQEKKVDTEATVGNYPASIDSDEDALARMGYKQEYVNRALGQACQLIRPADLPASLRTSRRSRLRFPSWVRSGGPGVVFAGAAS